MMRFPGLRVVIGLILALVSVAATAQWRDRSGKQIENTPSRASEKGFSASISIATTDESKRFHEEWYSTAAEHAPRIATIGSAHRGDSISILVFYSGCGRADALSPENGDDKAACPALLDLRMLKPDGSIYADPEETLLAQDQPVASASLVQLSPVELRVIFEPEDPLGTYTIEAVVDHPDRDALLTLSTTIELKAGTHEP